MKNAYVVVAIAVALALGLLIGIQLGLVSVGDVGQDMPVKEMPAKAPQAEPQPVKQAAPQPETPSPPMPQEVDSVAAAEAEADAQWAKLTVEAVEAVCTEKVKEKAGADAWAVFGCACEGTENDNRKEFDCTIETIQGNIAASIACVRSTKLCVLAGQGQESLLTLEEITQAL